MLRFAGEDGIVNHAEMRLGDDVIYLGAPGGELPQPRPSSARRRC